MLLVADVGYGRHSFNACGTGRRAARPPGRMRLAADRQPQRGPRRRVLRMHVAERDRPADGRPEAAAGHLTCAGRHHPRSRCPRAAGAQPSGRMPTSLRSGPSCSCRRIDVGAGKIAAEAPAAGVVHRRPASTGVVCGSAHGRTGTGRLPGGANPGRPDQPGPPPAPRAAGERGSAYPWRRPRSRTRPRRCSRSARPGRRYRPRSPSWSA